MSAGYDIVLAGFKDRLTNGRHQDNLIRIEYIGSWAAYPGSPFLRNRIIHLFSKRMNCIGGKPWRRLIQRRF